MTESTRKNRVFKTAAALVIAGAAYLIFVKLTGMAIPCLFHLVTGLKCPGCGITTVFCELASFEFKKAFSANAFLFVTSPFIVFELFYSAWLYIKGKKNPAVNEKLLIIYLILLLAWGVIRNLKLFSPA
ncbi:MAG: DUF2752 domain-containing protein [Lachnospiraceae bacterium]|nr:DUF2752 domain-containing protein [Lachnospiraceae bacterium]